VNKLLNFSIIKDVTKGEWRTAPKNLHESLTGGSFDTRSLGDADIFFALEGEQSDGHLYLKQLDGSGIRLIVVEKDVDPVGDIAILKVESTLGALHSMARKLAAMFNGRIISITGSSGKTTTKTWLRHTLNKRFNVLANIGSFNNQIGCPITILSIQPEHDILILEMGSSGLGELELLSSIAPADISILLNVGHAHLGKFGSLENTYIAKTEIFSHRRKNAVSFIPFSDLKLRHYLNNLSCEYFGKGSPEFSWEQVSVNPIKREQKIKFNSCSGERTAVVNCIGEYAGELLSGILAICCKLGMIWEDIESGLTDLPQEKGRSIFLKGQNDVLVLDDTYNANPESVISMMRTICSVDAKKYVAVIGNLAELDAGLLESADYIIDNFPDKITDLVLSGDTGRILRPLIEEKFPEVKTVYHESVVDIVLELQKSLNDKTVIGVKGSRSSHLERVVYALTGKTTTCRLSRCGRLNMCIACEKF